MEPGRLVVPLLLNERPTLGHILESLENRLQGDLIADYRGGVSCLITTQLRIIELSNNLV